MTSWAVVGSGILGIRLALDLREMGHEVTVFESGDSIGGLADAWEIGGITWDRHYHVILTSDSNTRAFIERLGLGERLRFRETRTGCFAGGRLHSVSSPIELMKLPILGLVDKARLGATVLYAARLSDWRRLEQIPVEAWLVRLSGRRTYERFWKPLLRSKLGDNVDHASAAFLWAIIQRLMRARRNGLGADQFGYVDGGYGTVMDRASAQLHDAGVEVITGARIERVASSPDGGVALHRDGAPDHRFDRVVVTTAAPIAADLIDGLDAAEVERLRTIRYQGIICPSLVLRRGLSDFYVTNITDDGLPFTGVIEMTALVPPEELGGNHLVYLPRYTTSTDPAHDWSDEEIRTRFVDGLRVIHPDVTDDDIVAFRVSRVRHVVPVCDLGYSERVPTMVTSVPNVFVVNGAQIVNGTLNVDETLALAGDALSVINGTDRPTPLDQEVLS